MGRACTIGARLPRALLTLAVAAALAGCPGAVRPPPVPSPSGPAQAAIPADARPFVIVPGESVVHILVYRAGTLAKAGHNHVMTSREIEGVVHVTPQLERTQLRIVLPVATLVVDAPDARREAGPEFAADVPQTAREGTRRNMLSPALLAGDDFPEITLASTRIEPAPGGALATVDVRVRDRTSTLTIPLRYEQKASELLADGQVTVRQSDLGLTPFSAMLGALQVKDEITIRFRILARSRPLGPTAS
jgi:polyisoprenoid-binding protein YceI